MNLATKAKALADALLETRNPHNLLPDPLPANTSAATRRNEVLFYDTAMSLMLNTFTTCLAHGMYDQASIHDEIDRRANIISTGWHKNGRHYVKPFATPEQLQEAIKIAKDIGITIEPKQGIPSPNCTLLEILKKDYMAMRLMFDGRVSQLTASL